MKIYKIAAGRTLYHETNTDRVPSIVQNGLQVGHGTNWKSGFGDTYGGDAIYAMESLQDAVLWAGKQDWAFNQDLGTGKVSIVEFIEDDDPWEIDAADPISQTGQQGKWLKRLIPVDPSSIVRSFPVTPELIRQKSKERDDRLFPN